VAQQWPEPAPASGDEASLLRVDRLGPAGGGCLSVLGALLAMAGFLMPWASCTGNSFTGLEIATSPDVPNRAAALLGLIPCLSLGILGVGIAMLPLAARERLRNSLFSVRATAGAALGVLALAGLCLAAGFLAGLRQAQQSTRDLLGLGLIKIEPGVWVTSAGLILALLGAAVATLSSFLRIPFSRRQQL
jgi:hypothetical protein